jgi:two-component system, LuxR family, response regulator FixJ
MMPAPSGILTISVVDDDPAVLGSLRFLLEAEGFNVQTFRSGATLLKSLAAKQADCFVIDYKMDTMDGLDVASRLRERSVETPIILITGYPDANITAKAAAAGAHHVLLKPHLEESLVSHIRQAMQEKGLNSGQ